MKSAPGRHSSLDPASCTGVFGTSAKLVMDSGQVWKSGKIWANSGKGVFDNLATVFDPRSIK